MKAIHSAIALFVCIAATGFLAISARETVLQREQTEALRRALGQLPDVITRSPERCPCVPSCKCCRCDKE